MIICLKFKLEEVLDMEIGTKLKDIRLKKRITLQQLSQKSGVSVGQLSQIERGISTPIFTNLMEIVKALDINFTKLLDEDDGFGNTQSIKENHNLSSCISVTRSNERTKILMPFGACLELLAPIHNQKIEFICLTYPAGTKVGKLDTHEGEECGIVLEGKFKGTIGDQEIILEAGDSISYDSNIPHTWEAIGDTEVKAIWAITPPSL